MVKLPGLQFCFTKMQKTSSNNSQIESVLQIIRYAVSFPSRKNKSCNMVSMKTCSMASIQLAMPFDLDSLYYEGISNKFFLLSIPIIIVIFVSVIV